MAGDNEYGGLTETHRIEQSTADRRAEESAQRECRRPQAGNQAVRFNVVRQATLAVCTKE